MTAVAYPSIDDVTEETTLQIQSDDGHQPYTSETELAEPPPSDTDEENNHDDYAEVDVCLPPPSDDEDEVDICVPPPSDDEHDDLEEDNGGAENGDEVPAYLPPDEDIADVPYPVDDEADYPNTYAYPDTNDAYGDIHQQYDSIPAVAPYPSEDAYGSAGAIENDIAEDNDLPHIEEKKKYDGDKAVVGFMPSNLRGKNRIAPNKKPTMTKVVATGDSPKKNSVADDYDKFMGEISALK